MKINKGLGNSFAFLSLGIIGSFYASDCCGADRAASSGEEKQELKLTLSQGGGPKTFEDAFSGGIRKGLEKTMTNITVDATRSVLESPVKTITTAYLRTAAAIRCYTQFRNPSRVLNEDQLKRLKTLLDEVLVHARENECDYADYTVIVRRVLECVTYAKRRLEVALNEYNRARKGIVSRSLLQRTIGLVTSRYDVHAIVQILEWVIADLNELEMRSQYTKNFDVTHYKKLICYLQADLDTLFEHLEPLV